MTTDASVVPADYYDLDQMGEFMHVHASTVRKKVNRGEWPHSRPGNRILFSPEDRAEILQIVRRPALTPATGRRRRAS